MTRISQWFKVVLVFALFFVPLRGPVAQAAPPLDDALDAEIANAMSAAPTAIAKDATILGWEADGMTTVLLREGTNGWTCQSDWPPSPINDPQCSDLIWTGFMEAYAAGTDPVIDGLGIAFMLQGGADTSNTDPFAPIPDNPEDWVISPAHIMFLMPDGFDAEFYSTTPSADIPYIMWDETPYEHLMVPLVAMTAEEMGDVSAEMQSAMSSAPAGISKNATILGNPETPGDPMVVLKEGTNGWICYPDNPGSPGTDPACQDPDFDAGFANSTTTEVPGLRLGYMLQGGSDASNTDPTLYEPAPGRPWVSAPAHVMAMIPGGFDPSYYTTDYNSGYPYIMMAGVAGEHLMIPVADMEATGDDALKAQMLANEIGAFDYLIDHNVDVAKSQIAEDFVWINAEGERKGREDLLAVVGDMALTFQQPTRDDIQVQILGPETVMVVYTLELKGSYDGQPLGGSEYTTSIWQKRGARWLNTFLQATPRVAAEEVMAKIANAESAAISVIGQDATIMDWDADGMPTVLLREGTNGWTCVTDWPASPVNDPQCSDPIWTAFMDAYAAGEDPVIDGVGLSYMLQGGADPSDTDPFAPIPAEGEPWVESPAHLMILMPGGFDPASFPTEATPDAPYIMWAGTPYEHLMVPVVPMPEDEMGDVSADQKNTMGAAPTGIAKYATIMADPAEEGGDMVVLQEGTNGWHCGPDWTLSPGNDPGCYEPIMTAGFDNGTALDVPSLGLSYMLRGGSDPSATDPTVIPENAEDWVNSPAHIMLMVPGGFDANYFTIDHTTGYPYIMWDGTDVEHLMVPVADWADMEMGE